MVNIQSMDIVWGLLLWHDRKILATSRMKDAVTPKDEPML